MTIELNPITSGYSTGLINDNFQAIEDYVNDKLLQRDGVETGEVNQMEVDLDMNSHFVFNLPEPVLEHQAARLKDVQNAIAGSDSANLISFTPYSTVSSTNVQAAIQEIVDEVGDIDDRELKGRSHVFVEDFGAVGDGTTDDTTAIQNAIDSGDPVAGIIGKTYLVTGLTKTNAAHVYLKDLDLSLDDSATTHCLDISNATGGRIENVSTFIDNANVAAADASGLFLHDSSNVQIYGGRFEGGKNDNYGTGAFHGPLFINNCTNISVDTCEMLGGALENCYLDLCFNSRIVNCYSHDPVLNSCIGTSRGGYNLIANCVAENSTTSAISANGIHNTVTGNIVRGTSAALSAGINVGHPSLYQADFTTVTGNTVIDAVEAGIAVTGCGNVVLSGNVVRADAVATKYGLFAANEPGDVTFDGNILVGVFEQNIRYFNSTASRPKVVITGNKADSSTSNAISISGAGEAVVAGNNMKNAGFGGTPSFIAFVVFSSSRTAHVSDNIFINDQGSGFGPESAIRAPGSTDVVNIGIYNNHLRGWVGGSGPFQLSTSSAQKKKVRDNDISDDPLTGVVTPTAGTSSTVVTNGNCLALFSMPTVIGSTSGAQEQMPAIQTIGDGSFTIQHFTGVDGSDSYRWSIQ